MDHTKNCRTSAHEKIVDFSKWSFTKQEKPKLNISAAGILDGHIPLPGRPEGRKPTTPCKARTQGRANSSNISIETTENSVDKDTCVRSLKRTLDQSKEAEDEEEKDEEEDEKVEMEEEATFTEDVCSLCKDLYSRCHSDKPPGVAAYKMFTVDALVALLRYNDRPNYNLDKSALAAMVREYMIAGCPPRCPKCSYGYLRFSNGTKRHGRRYFWCPGSTKDGKHFLGCSYKADRTQISRTPWSCPEPGATINSRIPIPENDLSTE